MRTTPIGPRGAPEYTRHCTVPPLRSTISAISATRSAEAASRRTSRSNSQFMCFTRSTDTGLPPSRGTATSELRALLVWRRTTTSGPAKSHGGGFESS